VLRGAELIVIDPRRIELAAHARWHLQLRPGTNVPLLNALAHVIVEEALYDAGAVPGCIDNWDEYRRRIARFPPNRAAEVCGVPEDAIREVARHYAACKPAMCIHGLGVTEHVQGTEGVMCLVNLAILTGNLGRAGSGVNPLRGQNNVQGAAHMGCEPSSLTGGAKLAEHRTRFEAAWNSPIPSERGRNLMQMIDAAAAGQFKALWAIGYDVAMTNPNESQTLSALKFLEFVVVQDLFLTETARHVGSVFLPACSSFEKDGTFMNSERRIQRVRKVIEPLGESRTDWRIVCDVAHALGHGEKFSYGSAEEIWNEIRTVWPAGAGMTYARLENGGLQWPCPTKDHPGTRILHADAFAGDRRFVLRPIEYRPTSEQTSDEFPLLLVTGRALYQFNASTMTGRSKAAAFQPRDELRVSPTDACRLGITDGQRIRVCSRFGEIVMCVSITDAVRAGQLFTTFQSVEQQINRLTGPHRDNVTSTPEYKVTAVRIETID
jgi:formate dehydrogenase major subunit